jgi:carboxyl-terminal processing protease
MRAIQSIWRRALRGAVMLLWALISAIAVAAPGAQRKALEPDAYATEIAWRFARRFPDEHLLQSPFDDTISRRAWSNYIDSLDYDHTYFLRSDIEEFRLHETTLDDEIQKGDVKFAFEVYKRFLDRVLDRNRYVDALLQKGFDLQVKETYRWKRRQEPWAAKQDEWNELWRLKVKNDYLQRVVAKRMADSNTAGDKDAKPDPNAADKGLSVEEQIRKRYRQLQIVMEDNDATWVVQRYLLAMAQAYDPHSVYMSPENTEDFDIEMKLSLDGGIGAELGSEDGYPKVMQIVPGGPADRDKSETRLVPGDKIAEVGDGDKAPVDIQHLPLSKTVRMIRGRKGTRVVLIVIPASDPAGTVRKRVELVRDEVKLEEKAANLKTHMVTGSDGVARKLGVIRLPAFYASMQVGMLRKRGGRSSAQDVARLLQEMQGQGVEGVILDLRSNGGGALMEAVAMAGLFVPSGPMVQMKDRDQTHILKDPDSSVIYGGPLVVLVNRLSASASEIVAGALQDYDRAVIVGDSKTHGKGSVQTILPVGRDHRSGTIKVTNAMYYRVTGSSTQFKGVEPDIVVSSPFDFMELGEEYLPNPMQWQKVPAASFSRTGDASSMVQELKAKSEKRRQSEPGFGLYTNLLARVERINKSHEVPLDIEERIRAAQMEKELAGLQVETDPDEENGNEKKNSSKPDVVLQEGMRILSDMVEKKKAAVTAATAPATARTGWLESIARWLRSL